MKKLLPTSNNLSLNKKGFTLVELLIVVAIIAILAAIGFAVLGNQSGSARDAKRKADIDQIAKAYEVHYNLETGVYKPLTNADFTSGTIPEDPKKTKYICVLGPNDASTTFPCVTVETTTFTVCAKLDAAPADTTTCNASNANCYCQSAAQANAPAAQCNNGKDDDSDTLIDLLDPQCTDKKDNDEAN